MSTSLRLTSPIGRIVWGNLYEARTTDDKGQPLTIKTGPNAGKPGKKWGLGLAIPKSIPIGRPWWEEPFLIQLLQYGQRSWPGGETQRPDFAWKIIDGDSVIPNKNNVKPSSQEGRAGHWVINMSTMLQAPRICNANGSATILEPNAVKPGYYVQVLFDVASNESKQTPGLYINPLIVALAGYGPEILTGPDAASAGFGQAQAPAGMSATPVGAMPTGTAPAAAPIVPPASVPPAAAPGYSAPPTAAAGPPVAVTPHQGFMAPPAVGAPVTAAPMPPAAPAAPPVPTGPVMTAKAGAVPYAEFRKGGWTDDMLRREGYMQ